MLKSILLQIKDSASSIIEKAYELNPWTNVYGLARSFLALSLLSTLLFTGVDSLFPTVDGELLKQPVLIFDKISIFYLMGENLLLAWLLSILILLAVIIGFFPQVTGILHWWVTYSYLVSGIIIEGGDQIASILTMLLIPVTLTDNRINHWFSPKESAKGKIKLFVWSIYTVICLQVSVIYLHAGVAKMFVEEWLNGTAAYYWFTHSNFGASGMLKDVISGLLSNATISTMVTWGTMIFEIILFAWLFMSRNKWNWKVLFFAAILFHFSIAAIHGLVSFMFTMTGALIIYFFPKEINLFERRSVNDRNTD